MNKLKQLFPVLLFLIFAGCEEKVTEKLVETSKANQRIIRLAQMSTACESGQLEDVVPLYIGYGLGKKQIGEQVRCKGGFYKDFPYVQE